MLRRKIPLLAKFAAAVALVAIGAGAGSMAALAASGATEGYVPGDQMDRAWQATSGDRMPELPEGYRWPAETPIKAGPDVQVDAGVLASTRAFYWMCAWEHVFLNSPSAEEQSKALDALPRLGEFDAMREANGSVAVWQANVVAPAAAGDPAPIRDEYAASCAAFDPYFPVEGR